MARSNQLTFKLTLLLCSLSLIVLPTAAQAQLFKNFGTAKNSAPKVQPPIEFRDKWAVLVGVHKYEDATIRPVIAARPNMTVLAKVLQDPNAGRFSTDHISFLFGSRATTANIVSTIDLDWLPKRALPNDLVLLYLCGRAFYMDDDALFCAYETDLSAPTKAGISIKALLQELRHRTQCKNIICLLDILPVLDQKWPQNLWSEIAQKCNVTIMSASASGMPSYPSNIMGTTLFTHYLSGAFMAAGGACNTYAISQFIYNGCSIDAKKNYGKEQAPQYLPSPDNSEISAAIPGSISKFYRNHHAMSAGGHPIDTLALRRPDLLQGIPNRDEVNSDKGEEEPSGHVDFSDYLDKMKKDINLKWKKPSGISEHKVVTTFSINRDGLIVEPSVVQSSGDELIDKSALEALRDASPLDPLPQGAPKSVQMRYVFDYHVTSSSTTKSNI